MRKSGLMIIASIFALLIPSIFPAESIKIYYKNWNLKGRIKGNKVCDKAWRLRYRIENNRIYDSDWKLKMHILKGDKIYDDD